MSIDVGNAFSYMFDDEDWIKKLAIGGGIILISPLLLFLPLLLLGGYMLQTLKNVRDGQPKPLPEWTDFGDLFMKGLMLAVIGFIYNIPSMVIQFPSLGLNILLSNPEQFNLDENLVMVLSITVACLSCLQFVVSLLCAAILPAAIISYAQDDAFGSAFRLGQMFKFISSNIGDYIVAILLSWVAGIVAAFGLIACCVGIVFTSFWSTLVNAHLYGQLARKMSASDSY